MITWIIRWCKLSSARLSAPPNKTRCHLNTTQLQAFTPHGSNFSCSEQNGLLLGFFFGFLLWYCEFKNQEKIYQVGQQWCYWGRSNFFRFLGIAVHLGESWDASVPQSEMLKRWWRLLSAYRQSCVWKCICNFHSKGEHNEIHAETCLACRKHTGFQKHRDTKNNLYKEILLLITA